MPAAVSEGDELRAPTVGTWRPAIGVGAPLHPGVVIGWLERAGRRVAVQAPRSVAGVATQVRSAGSWVAYGDRLVRRGEGGAVGSHPEQTDEVPVADRPPEGVTALHADTDGTVFLAPEPGSPPFARPGAEVDAHDTLALVEVMKTFSPVRTPVEGVVERVLVDDGSAVAAGQPLFWIAQRG